MSDPRPKLNFDKSGLKPLVDRIERLEEDKRAIAADIRQVYDEAKAIGFDTKILRKVIALRRMDAMDREEQQELIDLYMDALGMLKDTPLGKAALSRIGRPVPPTDEEKSKGVVAAFENRDGIRSSIAFPKS